MKIDEYAPDAMPISSANAKSLQRLAAEDQQRQDRQQRAERRRQRPDDDLAHRAVDDLREGGARHARDVLAYSVEHDDRVVQGEAEDGQQRRDRRRRHLQAEQGVDAGGDEDVVRERDEHRHRVFPLESQRDVGRDHDQRRDDRDDRHLADRLAEGRPDRRVAEVRGRAEVLVQRAADRLDLVGLDVAGDLERVAAQLLVGDALHLGVGEAELGQRVAHAVLVGRLLQRAW